MKEPKSLRSVPIFLKESSCGVPQGSVMSPLLFLIYINDIYKPSNKLGFYLFADDTNLMYAARNLKSLESVVNVELLNVCDWLSLINYP